MNPPLTRRTFLKSSAIVAAGVALAPRNWAQVRGANGDLRIALVGVGAQGRAHVKGYMEAKGVRIVALCDVDSVNLDRSVKTLRDEDLDRKVPTSSGPRPLVEVLHGLAAHDAYHAGQIRLTRKLLRGR